MNLKEMIKRGLSKKRETAGEQEQHPATPGLDKGEASLYEPDRPPDATSTRAKSTRHGKVTADKRNQ